MEKHDHILNGDDDFMGAEAAIIGGAVISFLFIYTMSKLDDKHFLLKIILLFFSAIAVLLIGQGTMGSADNCSWLPDSSTVSGSTTSYAYSYHCEPSNNGSNRGVLLLSTWYFRILSIYSIIYFMYLAFKFIKEQINAGKFKVNRR